MSTLDANRTGRISQGTSRTSEKLVVLGCLVATLGTLVWLTSFVREYTVGFIQAAASRAAFGVAMAQIGVFFLLVGLDLAMLRPRRAPAIEMLPPRPARG